MSVSRHYSTHYAIWESKAVRSQLKTVTECNLSYCQLGTPKAFQTSAQPGLTQALSTRLKVSLDPLVYAFDTPGVMLPFLGRGPEGAERGVKLALIGT